MPPPASHPANCRFDQRDAEYGHWDFAEEKTFDLMHLGHVVSCFDDSKAVMQKAFDHLTPGGWIEFQDSGLHFTALDESVTGTAIEQWALAATKGAALVGRDLTKPTKYASWQLEVGFVEISETWAPLPSNTWPSDPKDKKVGGMYMHVLTALIDGLTKFLILSGMSSVDAENLKARAKQDVLNPRIHIAFPFHVIYAQKPDDGRAPR